MLSRSIAHEENMCKTLRHMFMPHCVVWLGRVVAEELKGDGGL